jgi:hypothetical protein
VEHDQTQEGSLEDKLIDMGYLTPREIGGLGWCAGYPFLFTYALVVGLDEFGYRYRYCYEAVGPVMTALAEWDGVGDPPGPWIKRKGRGEDRLGPGAVDG